MTKANWRIPLAISIVTAVAYYSIFWNGLSYERDAQAGLAVIIFGPVTVLVCVLAYYPSLILVRYFQERNIQTIGWKAISLSLVLTVGIAILFTHMLYARMDSVERAMLRAEEQREREEEIRVTKDETLEKIRHEFLINQGNEAAVLRAEFENSDDSIVWNIVAQNQHASPDLLHEILLRGEDRVVASVLANPNTGTDSLDWIAQKYTFNEKYNRGYLKFQLMQHRNISPELMGRLSQIE